jgi:hypothetical protein
MKQTLLAAIFVLAASSAFSQPYLTCDAYPAGSTQPDDFVIVLNGTTHYSAAAENPDGSRYLWFDLNGLWEVGPNTTIVWARNVWGESAQVPFDFIAGVPASVEGKNTRVVKSP